MNDYPESLVEKVAIAIRRAYAASTADYQEEFVGDVSDWEREAVAALDALGLREETRDIYRNGDGLEFVLVSNPQDYAHFNQRRFVAHTDWEDA